MVTWLPPGQRMKYEPIVQEELKLAAEIGEAKRRFRESEAKLIPLPAEASGAHLPESAEYGGHPDQRVKPEQLHLEGTTTETPAPASGVVPPAGAVSDAITPNAETAPPDPAPLARVKERVRDTERKAKAEKKPHSVDDGRGPFPFDDESI
jgi:hypothetical protein